MVLRLGERPPLSKVRIWCREIGEETLVLQFGFAGRKPRHIRARDVRSGVLEIDRRWAALQQENKRASPRIDLDLEIQIGSDRDAHAGLTENISAGGLFVVTDNPHVIGDRLTLRFTLPNGDRALAVDSEVRWLRAGARGKRDQPAGIGLRFVDLAGEAAATIDAFLSGRLVSRP